MDEMNTDMTVEFEYEEAIDASELISALKSHPEVNDFTVTEQVTDEKQLYMVGTSLETIRTVSNRRRMVEVFHDHNSGRGDSNFYVDESGGTEIREQIDEAVATAKLSGNPAFPLPAACDFPSVSTYDPESLNIDAINDFLSKMNRFVVEQGGVKVSAAELFSRAVRTSFMNSNGAQGSKNETRVSLELVLLDQDSKVESFGTRARRRLRDFSLEHFIGLQSGYTKDALRAKAPRSGKRPVIFIDKTLDNVFYPLILKTSARAVFHNQSELKPGTKLPGGEIKGDAITMHSDALLPWGMLSYPFDTQGLPGKKVSLVENGVVSGLWSDARYAHYLNMEPTGSFANMIIEPGTITEQELREDRDALVVAAFSSFAPDPLTGRFAAEVKMGYEYRDGQVIPVRGGSVTGDLLDFSDITLSSERVTASHMVMPLAVRYGEMTVSGE